MTVETIVMSTMEQYLSREGVTQAAMMGAQGLKINGKYFAMLYKGELVVKLTKAKVDALVAAGEGVQFDPGHGRKMKEWVQLVPKSAKECAEYLDDAAAVVAAVAGKPEKKKAPSAKNKKVNKAAGEASAKS